MPTAAQAFIGSARKREFRVYEKATDHISCKEKVCYIIDLVNAFERLIRLSPGNITVRGVCRTSMC